ncbi:hypothetical protein GCM10009550_14790 [Actinocorallia libanotica]|uniref:Uncharacterized protein n=1 Tax=Actinocorallia libanotica TaxID=46162 RepID=A0ABN1QIA3_9ACTN
MADEIAAGFLDAFEVGAQCGCGDVLVEVDGDVHVVEGPDQVMRRGVRAGEVRIQDCSGSGALAPAIIVWRAGPPTVGVADRVRLAVVGEGGFGMQAVEL